MRPNNIQLRNFKNYSRQKVFAVRSQRVAALMKEIRRTKKLEAAI